MQTHRLNLNQNQITLLQYLYKFRFATTQLLSERRNISIQAVSKSLILLKELGYIDRKYEKSYSLIGKSASYYLTKTGMQYLRSNFNVDERALRAMYKNPQMSEAFIQHSLDVFRAYLNLRHSYPDTFAIYTHPEILEYDYLPEPTPDLLISRTTPSEALIDKYFLDLQTDRQFFVVKKRIDAFIQHFESGEWKEKPYPKVLIVCDDSNIESKLGKYVQKQLDDNYIDDAELVFALTTKLAFLNGADKVVAIWTQAYNPGKLLDLNQL